MANKKRLSKPKLKSSKPETVRQRAEKSLAKKQPRRRKLTGKPKKASQKTGRVSGLLGKKVTTHSHSDSSKYSFFTKHRSIVPSYLRNSFSEFKNIVWPSFPEAVRLTLAVLIFATVFAVFILAVDWVLDLAFEELILNESQNIKEFLKETF